MMLLKKTVPLQGTREHRQGGEKRTWNPAMVGSVAMILQTLTW